MVVDPVVADTSPGQLCSMPPLARVGVGARVRGRCHGHLSQLVFATYIINHRKRDYLELTLVSTQSATKRCALARC